MQEHLESERQLLAIQKKLKSATEEAQKYKGRMGELEEDLRQSERTFIRQSILHEKQAHDYWLRACALERELIQKTTKNQELRQRLIWPTPLQESPLMDHHMRGPCSPMPRSGLPPPTWWLHGPRLRPPPPPPSGCVTPPPHPTGLPPPTSIPPGPPHSTRHPPCGQRTGPPHSTRHPPCGQRTGPPHSTRHPPCGQRTGHPPTPASLPFGINSPT
ncbi:basic proline-rich protein-like, partial [Choloepus didactylus]|uniref:basic proline-rich protein-like n=1 Tax=Choloepus didactylus TaxID=27675 RepID=UPI00189C7C5F